MRGISPAEDLRESLRILRHVRLELRRHVGGPGEPCFVTKELVFELADGLEDAALRLGDAGWHAASLVAIAVEGQLMERITDARPVGS